MRQESPDCLRQDLKDLKRLNGLKVNLGSGQRRFERRHGWINVDCQAKWKPDVLAYGDKMPFEDGEVGMVVAHHVIEHVGLGEFDGVIRECYRVLEPGGSLIVTTPDLDALTKAYVRGKTPDGKLFPWYLFCVNLYGAYLGDEADRHKWLYDGANLAGALGTAATWTLMKSFDWRHISGADIAQDWWIQGVEAVK